MFSCHLLTTPIFARFIQCSFKLRHKKINLRSRVTPWKMSTGAVGVPSVTPLRCATVVIKPWSQTLLSYDDGSLLLQLNTRWLRARYAKIGTAVVRFLYDSQTHLVRRLWDSCIRVRVLSDSRSKLCRNYVVVDDIRVSYYVLSQQSSHCAVSVRFVFIVQTGGLVKTMVGEKFSSTDLHLANGDTLLVGQVAELAQIDPKDVNVASQLHVRKLQVIIVIKVVFIICISCVLDSEYRCNVIDLFSCLVHDSW